MSRRRRTARALLTSGALVTAMVVPATASLAQEPDEAAVDQAEVDPAAERREAAARDRLLELSELATERLELDRAIADTDVALDDLDARWTRAQRERRRAPATGATRLDDELAVVEREREAAQSERDRLAAERGAVEERERAVRRLANRQQQVADGAQQGTYACIMDEGDYSFIDSWGFARSGGRGHQGTDVMAPFDVDVHAVTGGTIGRMSNGGIGGIALRMDGDDGAFYYYAHLAGFAEGLEPGDRVEAGQLIGFNGDTGNARGGNPHVHFEVHPGGQGNPVNPYTWLRNVCPVEGEGSYPDNG